VNFLDFMGATNVLVVEAWLENMVMLFTLRDYTFNMKFHMEVIHFKESALLWWNTLIAQLNMVVENVSWELFEEQFWERYFSEELI
jgi:hypothetical protein